MKKFLIILSVLIILLIAVVAVLRYNDKIASDSPRLYKQGISFFNAADYQNAYYNFSKISKMSPLYKMALLRQAQSAERLSNYELAQIKYEEFVKAFPRSAFSNSARYSLAKSYYFQQKFVEAKSLFLKIKNSSSISEFSTGANYFLARIAKKENSGESKQYYLDYIKATTTGKYSLSCADELLKNHTELSTSDIELIGKVFFDNEKYKQALKVWYNVPLERSWANLAISNYHLSNKSAAKKQIETGIAKYTKDIDEHLLQRAYNAYIAMNKNKAANAWNELLLLVQKSNAKSRDYVLFKYAQVLPIDYADAYYRQLIKYYPESEFAPEAMWNIFFRQYLAKDYTSAKKIANDFLRSYSSSQMTPQMLFWLSKLNIKTGNKQEANNIYNKILSKYPDSYYAFRISSLNDKSKPAWNTNNQIKISTKKTELDFPIEFSNVDIKDLKLINTLLELGDYEVWLEADFNNKIVESWFAQKRGQTQRSMVLARDAVEEMKIKPPFNSVAYFLAYPLYYVDLINQKSLENSLTPYLVLSLVKEESYFNPNSLSSAKAVGLMQLMPATAEFVAQKFSKQMPAYKDLQNPEINLDLGCNYLKYIKSLFNDNELYAVIAYNAGQGSLNKWLSDSKADDYDEFIEMIPYKETRDYIKKVYRTYYIYTRVYK